MSINKYVFDSQFIILYPALIVFMSFYFFKLVGFILIEVKQIVCQFFSFFARSMIGVVGRVIGFSDISASTFSFDFYEKINHRIDKEYIRHAGSGSDSNIFNRVSFNKIIFLEGSLAFGDRIIFKNCNFIDVSFRGIKINDTRFFRCKFRNCIFAGSIIEGCEFVDCSFEGVNFDKVSINSTLFDPDQLDKNFGYKNDSNIAISTYQSIYKNSINEHQHLYAIQSLYMLRRSKYINLLWRIDGSYNRFKVGRICKLLLGGMLWVLGWGLRPMRMVFVFLFVVLLTAFFNFLAAEIFFNCKKQFLDMLYFTVVVFTSLGFGDITPYTTIGKLAVASQALIGFLGLSLLIASLTSRIHSR